MSYSEFTKEDFELIESEWQVLKDSAWKRCQAETEREIILKAFDFANQAHRNVRRRSGIPYIIHPIQVARIVVEDIGLGCKSISAALLHDVVEDTDYTVDDIRNLFGDKIAQLVDGLTKLKVVLDNEDRNKMSTVHPESIQAENFKRILLTLGDDARVVLIKLADRLHNCRTIDSMPEHKRDKILSETMYVFIPLAHRLGLYSIKTEMENIWLKWKEPFEYARISQLIKTGIDKRDSQLDEFIQPISKALEARGFRFEIKKRLKTPYSVWYKMQTKQVPLEEIYDLYAVRVVFDSQKDNIEEERDNAFVIYRIVTGLYTQLPGRLRNWIQNPKSNGYEALHCTVMSHFGTWVEVQIRSRRMDDIAEKGIAAHWVYKKNGYTSESNTDLDKWLSKVNEILSQRDLTSMELLDIIHSDLITKEITVFTPKGQQKNIPAGSTALDFAYIIHTDIGNKAIAAKVNMKLARLSQTLKAGDQVEIITAAKSNPKMEWLKFLKTRNARMKVVDFFRESREEISAKGESIYNERLKTMQVKNSNDILRKFMEFAQVNDIDELYFRIGLGLMGPEDFRIIMAENNATDQEQIGFLVGPDGPDGTKYVMAECCNPIPGDPVIGFKMVEGTVTVHKKSCPIAENIASKYGDRVVVPKWSVVEKEYPIRISIKGIDRLGMVNEITQCISLSLGINMRKVNLGCEDGLFDGYIELLVKDKSKLDALTEGLKKIDGIQDVVRTDI